MFELNSSYFRYCRIVFNAMNQDRKKGGSIYYEGHHVIPKCLGGANDKENIVLLTGREHFLCHYLLTKMSNDRRLVFALCRMMQVNQYHVRPPSKLFDRAREKIAFAKRQPNMKLRGVPKSDAHKAKLSSAKMGRPGNNRSLWEITTPEGVCITTRNRKEYCLGAGLNWDSVKSMTQKSPNYKGYLFVKLG